MNNRCVLFWVRGFFGIQPAPYHSDGRCWMSGRLYAFGVMAAMVPVAIFALGFVLGRQ